MTATRVLQGLILSAGLCVAVWAAPSAVAAASATQKVGLERTGPGTFSIDVEGADVHTVCRAVSEFSGRNIVVTNNVKGEISIRLQNVGWEEALHTMLRSAGLDFVDENGILRVDEMLKLRGEQIEREAAMVKSLEVAPLETRIIKLNYANAAELTAPLQAAVSRRGSILVERRTNSLIVTDLAANLDRVEKMSIDLDATTPQIEITAKLVDVSTDALRDLGIEWNIGQPTQYFSGPISATAHVPNPGPNQDLGAIHKTGIASPATRLSYGIFQNWGSFEAQIQMLEEDHKANIISNPRITTVDNREAKILVGQKIPLIVQDVAGNPVSQLVTIGIQLKVTPHLTSDKKVVMDLHPEVSDLANKSTVQGGVIINTAEADTRVMVEDGQTAVIGGLIRTNESSVHSGLPVLKDLPLLGFLFRSSSNARENRELIIFVTPRIMTTMASK